jgi:hypothetical protein
VGLVLRAVNRPHYERIAATVLADATDRQGD